MSVFERIGAALERIGWALEQVGAAMARALIWHDPPTPAQKRMTRLRRDVARRYKFVPRRWGENDDEL